MRTCDKCIEQAHGIVEEIKSSEAKLARDYFKAKPKEIRAFLDQYVIGQDKSNVGCRLQSLQTFNATATRR
jgi:ATP-dependent Clp protease ATP-binding subunit ClpX